MDIHDELPARMAPEKKAVKVYMWTCEYCGQSFEANSHAARYCSPYHRKLACLERRRSEKR